MWKTAITWVVKNGWHVKNGKYFNVETAERNGKEEMNDMWKPANISTLTGEFLCLMAGLVFIIVQQWNSRVKRKQQHWNGREKKNEKNALLL
jgi:hypothetical protein